ncbi:MAG: HNH endonuclease [Prevotella sp.]|nr:HNH endonuclease [Prevotella sp.]
MTKYEYHKLLQSDYWKGFSYSIIKERNFTCEDCGAHYPYQRNKLEVHHLVYRDIAPWSYKPEEMLVLCHDCHRKRHGIVKEPDTTTMINDDLSVYNEDTFSTDSRNVSPSEMDYGTTYDRWGNRRGRRHNYYGTYSDFPIRRWRLKLRYILLALICCAAFAVMYQSKKVNEDVSKEIEREEALIDGNKTTKRKAVKKVSSKREALHDDMVVVPEENELTGQEVDESSSDAEASSTNEETTNYEKESTKGLSTIELLEKRTHDNVVKQAKRAGVSTEGTTSEILDRITRKNLEKYQ